ncbi:DUF937 domain-containing protein [Microvirga guangxiensis]|uniref:DUF937 domain-containing protein n=1 Tax=Microvirga guangxiensis TaxID=549386 RepID=A0A1G5JLM6_9HYPH|nr:DUF937 domain-containing protein [Microvirga guangxiensis]SCY88800.1 hypothetical protein SAMN02927923_02703 [Microvirga guangxiensis]
MFNWFDLMRQAQTQAGFEALARQFQLTSDQQQRAMAALMPAFIMGLQHAMIGNDPNRVLQSLMSGGYQNFWQMAARSFTPQAQQEGRHLLDQLFGSDEASRRVAHQAADFAGIGVETMQQILPLYAGLVAGGLSQWMRTQAQGAPTFASAEEKPRQDASNPWMELWGNWMKLPEPEKKPAVNPFQEMMSGFLQMSAPTKPQEPAQPSLGEMMEKGQEMQMQYLTSLQSILEEAWKTGSRKP